MQSERVDNNTENNLTNERKSSRHSDKIDEMSESNDTQTNPSENISQKNSNIVNNENLSTMQDENLATTKKSLEIASESLNQDTQVPNIKSEEIQSTNDESQSKDKESTPNDGNESNEINKSKTNEGGDREGNTAMTMMQDTAESHTEETISNMQDEVQQEISINPTAPPKPPRLKSVSIDDIVDRNKKESSEDDDADADKPEKDENEEETKTSNGRTEASNSKLVENPKSANSKTETSAGATENPIENAEEIEHVEKPEETKADGTQDDVDVVQSPAPRTG